MATYNIWGASTPHRYWQDRSELRGARPGSPVLTESDESTIWRRRRALLATALRDARPDIVALQEVPAPQPGREDRASVLARDIGGSGERYQVALSTFGDGSRTAVLTRQQIQSQREFALDAAADGFGGYPVVLEVATAVATIWTTHLPVGPDSVKDACVRELAERAASARTDVPLLICGDLNCQASSRQIRWLLDDGRIDDTWPAAGGAVETCTMPLPTPTWRLDYVLLRRQDGMRPVPGSACLLGTRPDGTGLFASDHVGVAVDLEPARPFSY
ncbi:Metal-dependent hydrolase, endonuclease/exonuclease/phosphatase family [Micromonospora inyonensis]|uniref:Metal-dependent hydrolase, endonuclease/exonuclease/phosphatase family n=1 Tax=Micromonospora inyonensis TaxID=47866 RepID=A0A1C6RLG6_9ACTN|nr:Metal-dependent hydrolase, endonuclease/exonuclease/phosphatase family [Micromonospora inyonensis]